MDSTKPDAAPIVAITHIQKTAPGPPVATAMAMPAMLPTPTREAAETQKAWKVEMWPSRGLAPAPSVIRRNISGMQRICTKRVRTVNQRPMPISITMRT